MADIDTSQNRDPSPTRDELLALRDRMLARLEGDGRVRDFGRPARIIRSANLLTTSWRADVYFLVHQRGHTLTAPNTRRVVALAETGEHLGLERVGLVVETTEVAP